MSILLLIININLYGPPRMPSEIPPLSGQQAILRLSSRELLRGRAEIEIVHGGRLYRLRITASGKLILTS